MINRELIRIKAVQLTYAYFQNPHNSIDSAEKELLFSLTKAHHLYHTLLLLITAITKMAQKHVEIATVKAEREGLMMPSERFSQNKFAAQLETNDALMKFVEEQKNFWSQKQEFVKNLLDKITESEIYKAYMSSDDNSYESDREVWRKLYKEFIQNNDDVAAVLEEDSIYWNDDKEVIDTFVLKTIKRFEEEKGCSQELLPDYDSEEDKEFAQKLFRTSIQNAKLYHSYISQSSHNWNFSRLAYMDIIIMQLAIAEMLSFPMIPLQVTINEFVSLAKLYSTPKSGRYINGMLDAIARRLIEENETTKRL